MQIHKVIVTNAGALRAKYGTGFARVRSALTALAASDRARGLTSKVVAIDSVADMKAVRGKPVASARDQRGAKAAIDALCRQYQPDYLVILGAGDVVPHITLTNPMRATDDPDDDASVPTDLPYACDTPFSRNPAHFLGPTRVIGRIPDELGATEPQLLLALLAVAAKHAPRERAQYSDHFALSAKVWQKSTRLSVQTLFGAGASVHTSPPDGPLWSKAQLAPRIHFINCHGDTLSPKFFGEFPRGKFFDAHDSARLPARVTEGSVIAAECCYGAQLYDPADAQGARGICSSYLREGAYGFFGSTNIAYGPSEGNGQADLICRFFIEAVLGGSSLGRAAVEARQRFVAQFSHLDPSDLKTAVQFILLGDPSVHAVKPVQHAFARSRTVARAIQSGLLQQRARSFRRERIARTGYNLSRSVGAVIEGRQRTPGAVRKLLEAAARESGLRGAVYQAYRVKFPAPAKATSSKQVQSLRRERSVHMVKGTARQGAGPSQPVVTAIIATLEGQRVVHLRRVHSR
jgi:hypothetical protein